MFWKGTRSPHGLHARCSTRRRPTEEPPRTLMAFQIITVYNRIPELIAFVEAESRSVPKKVADKILISAKGYVPVVTGHLRDSGQTRSVEAGKTAEILFDAEYAAYVEYGTYKM